MSEITITIPPSIDAYRERLQAFFEGMVKKLDKNSHKSTPTTASIPMIIDFIQLEVDEFEEQYFEDQHAENAMLELCDVANYAFLAYAVLLLEKANADIA